MKFKDYWWRFSLEYILWLVLLSVVDHYMSFQSVVIVGIALLITKIDLDLTK